MKSERDDIKLELITEEELNEIKESSEYVNLLLTNRLKKCIVRSFLMSDGIKIKNGKIILYYYRARDISGVLYHVLFFMFIERKDLVEYLKNFDKEDTIAMIKSEIIKLNYKNK